ncbi:MAG: glutathione ABC transporter substrate-binding protein [Trueperaceae bacterium]|nr:MAG: glutathione ABC transporter substrate-binding protein [Trueperaceae bacterium]
MRRFVWIFSVLCLPLFSVTFAQETVVIAQQLEHGSLNPADNRGLSDNTVGRVLFEGLVGFDRELNLVPELATAWEINDEATEITFTLRQGVVFHDGTPFTAEEVKAYFDWARDPDNSLGGRARSIFEDVVDVEILDADTVRFSLSKPNGAMIFNFATANGRIISSHSIETYGEDIGRNPVGTGPFQFQEWIDGQMITVTAFADYWGEPAKVEAIEFRVVPNDATRIALLQSGEAHFIEMVPPALVGALEAAPNIVVEATESVFARILPVNTQIAPFDDVRVRRALNHAIDREQLVQVALQGFGTALTSPVLEPVFGYSPQTPYEYDLEKAQQLLAEAGVPDGFSASVLTFNSTEFTTVGQVLQQMLSKVGVSLELQPTERGALVDRIFKPFEETDLEMSLVGASTPTGDADRALKQSFASSSWPPAFNNWSFYSNPKVDELIEAGATTGDQAERSRLYAEAQEIIWNDAPWIFLYSPNNIAGKSSNLEGVFYMPPRYLDARAADFVE